MTRERGVNRAMHLSVPNIPEMVKSSGGYDILNKKYGRMWEMQQLPIHE